MYPAIVLFSGNSNVFLAIDKDTQEKFIVKMCINSDETNILKKIGQIDDSNKYFVQKIKKKQVKKKLFLVFEAGSFTLEDMIKFRRKLKIEYNEGEIAFILSQNILPALKVLYDHNISH